jgi:glycosyltransferase involved in cell wall biosynthesis
MRITNDVLFLTLDTFSNTGGIQKVCRAMSKALSDRKVHCLPFNPMRLLSLYDANEALMEEYIPTLHFRGFNCNKAMFILTALFTGLKSRTIMLSHINLLPVAFLIKLFSPAKRIILIAHGVEVWRDPGKRRKAFLNKHVEIWAVSEFTGNHLNTSKGIKKQNIRILNNCLDPFFKIPLAFGKPAALLKQHSLTPEQPVLLTITRLSSFDMEKGYDAVIRCLPALLKTYPNLKYVIGGKCELKEKQRLSMLIDCLNLREHVTLVGHIPEEDLAGYYLLCDVFLLPSKKEGFGLVLIEAAACGARIIAGNKDGSADALRNGQLGTLINPDAPDEIIQAVKHALGTHGNTSNAERLQHITVKSYGFEQYKANVEALLS